MSHTIVQLGHTTAQYGDMAYQLFLESSGAQNQDHWLKSTPASFIRDFITNPHPAVRGFVAVRNTGEVEGFVAVCQIYSMYRNQPCNQMRSLYVIPTARKSGLGKKIVGYIAQLSIKEGCCYLLWDVLETNINAQNFYTHLGLKPENNGMLNYFVKEDELERLAALL